MRFPPAKVFHAAPLSSPKHQKEPTISSPSPVPSSEYPCFYPDCGHVSSQAYDRKRHMTIHFLPVQEELLDCKYEWCERTGARGFKRKSQRKAHYRTVHKKGTKNPRTDDGRSRGTQDSGHRSSPPDSTRHLAVGLENANAPVKSVATEENPSLREKGVPLSSNHQASILRAEALGRLTSLQLPELHAKPPDQESVELKIPIQDPDVRMIIESTAALPDDAETESSEANDLTSPSDNKSDPERSRDRIFGDLGANVKIDQNIPATAEEKETLKAMMSCDSTEDKLVLIKSQILKTLLRSEVGQYQASLKVEWDILAFMKYQFRDPEFPTTSLGPVVTISGSVQRAQATTCLEYIRKHWPAYGSRILDAVQDALHSATHTSQSNFVTSISSHAELKFNVTKDEVCLNIKSGTLNVMVNAVQQLAWMGAALRTSSDGQVQYCEPRLEIVSKARGAEPAALKITFDLCSPSKDDQSCWFPLFTNPVIAHHFPTAQRKHHDVGLEIPLDMMAALGGARHEVDLEGGLVLKGYSTVFVPIKRHENSVQWHLICAQGEDRISCHEASAQCPNRALLEDLDHEDLRTTRAFLGWWKEAETHLGTANADYKSIDWSKAKEAGTSLRLNGGTFGISKILTASVNFALGPKDGPFHYSQQGPFQKTIDRAEQFPVLLYDQKDRRACLVPALLVILHIIQLQKHIKPFVVGGTEVQIPPLDPSRQIHSAREVVEKSKLHKLFDCETEEEKEYCIRDAVLDTWSYLDCLVESEATTQADSGVPVRPTLQSTLYGREFRDVAEEERYPKRKVQLLERTSGRWCDLVKDVKAVVLFASGLGDIIKPRSESAGLCRKWRHLPKGKDYLAVCVPMLENFYAKAGHRKDHQYLTSAKLQWHRGHTLFEQCSDSTSNCCECDRTQQIYHDSMFKTFGHVRPPGELEKNGCVIFGQANHSMRRTTKQSANSKTFYRLSNDHIDSPVDSRLTSMTDDCTAVPQFVSHLEPLFKGDDRTRTPSPDDPPSLRVSDDFPLNEQFKPKKSRRRLPHPETRISDRSGDIDEAMPRVCSASGPQYYDEQENGALVEDVDGSMIESNRSQGPSFSHGYAPVTIPKINGYRAVMKPCQHVNGCSCKTRQTAHFEQQLASMSMSTTCGVQKS